MLASRLLPKQEAEHAEQLQDLHQSHGLAGSQTQPAYVQVCVSCAWSACTDGCLVHTRCASLVDCASSIAHCPTFFSLKAEKQSRVLHAHAVLRGTCAVEVVGGRASPASMKQF